MTPSLFVKAGLEGRGQELVDLYQGSGLFKVNAAELAELVSRASASYATNQEPSPVVVHSPSDRPFPLASVSIDKSAVGHSRTGEMKGDKGSKGYDALSKSASCLAAESAMYVTPWYYSLWILLCK